MRSEGRRVKRVAGLDWPLLALAGCLLALSAAGARQSTASTTLRSASFSSLQSVPYAIATWLVLRGAADGLRAAERCDHSLVGVAMRAYSCRERRFPTTSSAISGTAGFKLPASIHTLHVPSEEVLTPLRDAAIYPYINRADYAPTIYPPTSQIVFYLVTRISEAPIAMKAAMVAFEGLAVWAMLRLLALRGLPRSRILLYAWHPLPCGSSRAAATSTLSPLPFCCSPSWLPNGARRSLPASPSAPAHWSSTFPLVTAPALYRRWDWRFPVAFIATIAALYLPYIGAGAKVFGFLGSYISEEGLDRGSGIFLWQLLGAMVALPQQAFAVYVSGRGDRHGGTRPLCPHAARSAAAISPAACCSRSLSPSWSRRITPGTSPGWCRSCVSIPPLA
jgi:hypothetical protein